MNATIQHFWKRPKTKADLVEHAVQQLKLVFPFINKEQELETEHVPSVMVDIVARSSNGRLILFEVIHVPPLMATSLSFTTYPPLATLKDTVAHILPDLPPIVVALTTSFIPEAVRRIFAQAQIPLIKLSPDPVKTIARLHTAFGEYSIDIPELASDSEIKTDHVEEEGITKPRLFQELKHSVLERLDKLNLTVFAFVNIVLIIAVGIISIVSKNLWPIEFAALVLAIIAAGVVFIRERKGDPACINPFLIIEKDERKLSVDKNEWHIERHILLKARRKVESFGFQLTWSGSSQKILITCRDDDGVIQKQSNITSKALRWFLWELKFHKPMKRGELRPIVLKYTMPDPRHEVNSFYAISYTNVWRCKEFECRLRLSDNIKPEAVYLVRGDERGRIPKESARIIPTLDSHEYVVHEKPKAGSTYTLEWKLKNGKSQKALELN